MIEIINPIKEINGFYEFSKKNPTGFYLFINKPTGFQFLSLKKSTVFINLVKKPTGFYD